MAEESTTPDLVELTRRAIEAAACRDFDAAIASYAPESVWDASAVGLGTYRGVGVIRRNFEEWTAIYEDFEVEIEENLDLGNGVILSVTRQRGRVAGSSGYLEFRYASVTEWTNGLIEQVTLFTDIDEARDAAERLAEERAQAVSQENVEMVRRAIAAINARDIDAYLACCAENVELLMPLAGAEYLGADGIRRFLTDIEDIGPDLRIEVQRVRAIGDSNALAFTRFRSTGRASGIVTGAEGANVYDFIEGKISRIRIFLDRDEALKAVGLPE